MSIGVEALVSRNLRNDIGLTNVRVLSSQTDPTPKITKRRSQFRDASVALFMLVNENETERDTSFDSMSSNGTSAVQFGDVVAMRKRPVLEQNLMTQHGRNVQNNNNNLMIVNENENMKAQESKRRNFIVAIFSILLAITNYVWQFIHPITPIQLLFTMQQNSQPISIIGNNEKPTVVDFWAPWCENCKLIAPTLRLIEDEYMDRVNFVMIDGDKTESWPYIEAFGVDAIPHLALVSAQGDVETALIGPIPKHVLEADLDVLLENVKRNQKHQPEQALPHQMLDVFAGNPEGRRVRF